MNKTNLALGVALVAVVIAIGSIFYNASVSVGPTAGNVTPGTRFPHGISIGNPATLGTNPTNIAKALYGTCVLIGADVSQTASTTAFYDCAVSGVVSTDTVAEGQFASSTSGLLGMGWNISSVVASSTSGYLTFGVQNLTGANKVMSAYSRIGSTTNYAILGTQ